MKFAIHHAVAAALTAVIATAGPPAAGKADLRRLAVRDVKTDHSTDAEATFGRPVSISHDIDAIYVVDAEAHEIRAFSKAGVFLRALGRKGQGPGEFDAPADLDARDGRLYVADKFNDRIQVLDRAGKYLGGFKVPFSPDQVCALDGGKIVVSHLPLGLRGPSRCSIATLGKGGSFGRGWRATYRGTGPMTRSATSLSWSGEGGTISMPS